VILRPYLSEQAPTHMLPLGGDKSGQSNHIAGRYTVVSCKTLAAPIHAGFWP